MFKFINLYMYLRKHKNKCNTLLVVVISSLRRFKSSIEKLSYQIKHFEAGKNMSLYMVDVYNFVLLYRLVKILKL